MDDSELERIKQKKRVQLLKAMEAKKREDAKKKEEEEKLKDLEARKKQLLQSLLLPDALVYLNTIRKNNESLARKIEDTVLVMYVNHLIDEKLTRTDVKVLERRYTGKESKIMVKRRGEDLKSFSEEIKDQNKK